MRLGKTSFKHEIANTRYSQSQHLNLANGEQHQEDLANEQPEGEDNFQPSYFNAIDLSEEEEIAQGDEQEQELLTKYGLWKNSKAIVYEQQVMEVLNKFGKRVDLVYRFQALNTEIPFASSCCNGSVNFSRGLLNGLKQDEIAFWGAHELAHTELRHFATRNRRLGQLERSIPAALSSMARMRLELAATLTVRHQEEFEADQLAAQWLGQSAAHKALKALHKLCLERCPESLQRPTHPAFKKRLAFLGPTQQPPFDGLSYLWGLQKG